MMGWLFGSIMSVILVVGAILLCIFVPEARKFVVCCIAVIFVGLSVYCGIQLNFYYNSEGGIYGYITQILGVNTSTKLEDMKFSLNNIVLTQDDENEYSALIYPEEVITLEKDKEYTIYVNNVPLISVDTGSNYILADYTYRFYNDDMTVALTDTLRFNLSFDAYMTTFKITTYGGQTAVNYWNNYFARNKLEIRIDEHLIIEESKIQSSGASTEETATLTYYVNDEEFSKTVYPLGTEVKVFLTPTVIVEGKYFQYWSLDGTTEVQELTMNKNYSLHAVLNDDVVFSGCHIVDLTNVSVASYDLNKLTSIDLMKTNYCVTFSCGVMDKEGYSGNVTFQTLKKGERCYIPNGSGSSVNIAEIVLQEDGYIIVHTVSPATRFSTVYLEIVTIQVLP